MAYPKIIFMWPTWLIALAAAIFLTVVGDQANSIVVVTWTFLVVLGVNLVVLGFDFPRTTSLTLFFLGVALVLAAVLLVVYVPNILPAVTAWITEIHPRANATFYWLISIVLTVIFALGRTPGWIAHWHEMISGSYKIGRPRQLYTGSPKRDYVPMNKRG